MKKESMTTDKNRLLKDLAIGEISAIEVYDRVLEKINDAPDADRLKEFRLDHNKAKNFWQDQERIENQSSTQGSNIWGKVAQTFIETSKLFGNRATLMALKEAEEYGLKQYQKALSDQMISSYQKDQIRNEFIPNQMRHVNTINALIRKNR
tara:strand:- start:113143 stop:113595 length:453 start_codon:yes stop_codon:yes gene_type:complete